VHEANLAESRDDRFESAPDANGRAYRVDVRFAAWLDRRGTGLGRRARTADYAARAGEAA
jgi:hypothetical protein